MLENLRPALIITRREIRDQFRDWRIVIPILVLTLVFPAIMNFTARRATEFVGRFGAEVIGDRLIPFLLMVVGFFPISISMVIALESFVGEKERRSIEPLLASPLTDWHLYLGKLLAVVFPPLAASYLGIGVYLFGVYRQIGWTPEPVLMIQILLLTFVQALVMVAGAVVISTQATSVRAANLLASFIIIPMAFLIQGESMVMFWGQYDALWPVVFGLAVLAAVLVRTGISHFNREEMLGRELDALNLKGAWISFRNAFTGEAPSIREWYRLQAFPAVKRLRNPALLTGLLMAAAVWIGVDLAADFPLPATLLDVSNLRLETFSRLGNISLMSPSGVLVIWLHNLRVVLLALLLGAFSFSVFGLLIVMLPLVLVGYFAAAFAGAGISPGLFAAAFVLPHGILEIPALLLAGAGILQIGARIVAPSQGRSIGEVFLQSLAEWCRVLVGFVVPLLLAAAVLEVFVTPNVAVRLLGG
ncbi:MAG TPA: stage II sporulation protein M [Anaerolineales bacterium]|nr:stage II sporulation protein M [Anaerolineales bacterium]